jgi:hypothetical protein
MEVQEQVDELRQYMVELAYESRRTDISIRQLSKEMKEFKEDSEKRSKDADRRMEEFKIEMKEFKDDSEKRSKDADRRMEEFKIEMKEFKDDSEKRSKDADRRMEDFKAEMKEEHKKMNKQWGDLANKMGTIVEDIILPSVVPVLEKYFECEIESVVARVKRKKKAVNLRSEFDVIASSEDTVFLIETKSSPNEDYLNAFLNKEEVFRKLCPEYNDKKLTMIYSGIYIEQKIIDLCTSKGVYAMAYKEWDYMDILNFDKLRKKR